MLDALGDFFKGIPPEIYVLIISILPIVELRGAIPVGAALGLPFWSNYPLAIVGNLLPIPIILMFMPKILDFFAKFKFFRPIVLWLRKKAYKHSAKVIGKDAPEMPKELSDEELLNSTKNAEAMKMTRGTFIALFLFVAIPIPGTGAWTGALIALTLNLKLKKAIPPIALGVFVAGIIVAIASFAGGGLAELFVSDRLIDIFNK